MPCSNSMGHQKVSSAIIYIQEEVSDARMRCDELKAMINKALGFIQASGQRDHFYEVAGDIIESAPVTVMKLERALGAASMGISKIDYEEQRQIIRPEKVEELERVLENIRIRTPRRIGGKLCLLPDYQMASC